MGTDGPKEVSLTSAFLSPECNAGDLNSRCRRRDVKSLNFVSFTQLFSQVTDTAPPPPLSLSHTHTHKHKL